MGAMRAGTLATLTFALVATGSPAPALADGPAPRPTSPPAASAPPSASVLSPPATTPLPAAPVAGTPPPAAPPTAPLPAAPVAGTPPPAAPPTAPLSGGPPPPVGPAPWAPPGTAQAPAGPPGRGSPQGVFSTPTRDWGAPARAPIPPSVADDQFRSRRKLLVSGMILLGIGYYASIMVSGVGASRNNKGSKEYFAGFVPVVGPFVGAGLRAAPNDSQTASDLTGTTFYLAVGAIQAVGAGLLIGGLRMPVGRAHDPCAEAMTAEDSGVPRASRPCRGVTASLQPIVTPTFAGAGLTGTF